MEFGQFRLLHAKSNHYDDIKKEGVEGEVLDEHCERVQGLLKEQRNETRHGYAYI
jgi:hypothetical protein